MSDQTKASSQSAEVAGSKAGAEFKSDSTANELHRVFPTWDDLLPTPSDKEAFADASAALEAGRLVRKLRTIAGLTQVQLATRINVSQARVSAIENGDGRDGPTYSVLRRIAVACGASWPFGETVALQAEMTAAQYEDASPEQPSLVRVAHWPGVTLNDSVESGGFCEVARHKRPITRDARPH